MYKYITPTDQVFFKGKSYIKLKIGIPAPIKPFIGTLNNALGNRLPGPPSDQRPIVPIVG